MTKQSASRSRRKAPIVKTLLMFVLLHQSTALEDTYLSDVKNSCFKKGEVVSCLKYKALRLMSNTMFGPHVNDTSVYGTNGAISIVRMVRSDDDSSGNEVESFPLLENGDERGFKSEWARLAQYAARQARSFLSEKGLKIELPQGSRTFTVPETEGTAEKGRGKKKKLAILLPLLGLLATVKTKLLLIPILLTVIFIKKLLIVGALLLPSVFSTIKMCKVPQTSHSHWASAEPSPEFSSAGYGGGGGGYSYSGGSSSGYGKDWAASRAYNAQRARLGQPNYITTGGNIPFSDSKI